MKTNIDIRNEFIRKLTNNEFELDKSGSKMLEIIGAQFVASDNFLFGTPNEEWNNRELNWYKTMSLNVNDIEPPIPKIWQQVSSTKGYINSNYGWCVWSPDNYSQYDHVKNELKNNPDSRRAQMIYTRPSIHEEYNTDGMSDFICTTAVQYFIRNNALVTHVTMRSNDAVFGYKGDFHWQQYISNKLAIDLGVRVGDIIWNAGSLHVYERHFHLIK